MVVGPWFTLLLLTAGCQIYKRANPLERKPASSGILCHYDSMNALNILSLTALTSI